MKKRRFFALFLVLGLLVSLLSVPASAFEEIDVDARAALLVEKETGEILYEKNAHEKNYPASITKLTVALLVFEAIDAGQLSLDQPITARESAFEGLSIYGSTAGIKVGEVLSVEQLLQCMLIVSANEACNILAEAVCGEGNISQFVQRMNERAAALGCENTHYVNTSGLHDPDHYTTAWDIYLITRALMPYEKFMEICNSKSAEIAETDHNQRHVLHSTNRLISNWRELGYLYRDAQGIKTGSTEEAGHCLVSSAVRGDRQLVSVVLGAEKITLADGKSTLTKSFSETIRLFDYGFDCFSRREVVSADELVREVPVALSSEANYVVAHPAESITRMLPTELDLSELTRDITLPDSVDAPIAAGDELGEMTVSYNGTVYGTVKLLALSDVSASWLLVARRDVADFFSRTVVRIVLVVLVLLILAFLFLRGNGRGRRYGKRSSERAPGMAISPPVIAAAGAEHRGRQTVKVIKPYKTDGVSRPFSVQQGNFRDTRTFVLDFCPFPCYTAFIVR